MIAVDVQAIKRIGVINTYRSQGRQHVQSDSGTSEQVRGVESCRRGPNVAGVKEGTEVERLTKAETDLSSHSKV